MPNDCCADGDLEIRPHLPIISLNLSLVLNAVYFYMVFLVLAAFAQKAVQPTTLKASNSVRPRHCSRAFSPVAIAHADRAGAERAAFSLVESPSQESQEWQGAPWVSD